METAPKHSNMPLILHRPNGFGEKLKYARDQLQRKLNKLRGLPATENIGTMANLLKQLRTMAEEKLGETITAAVAAVPRLPGLTEDDLKEAMEYAGLKMLSSYRVFGVVTENSAAWAGSGYGLCSDPANIKTCEREEDLMSDRLVLSLSYTNAVFILTYSRINFKEGSDRTVFHFDLGLQSMNEYPSPAAYWRTVTSTIREFVEDKPKIDTLQLLGEKAFDHRFLDAVGDALRHIHVYKSSGRNITSLRLNFEPNSLAARGAAELAKRYQMMTWNCVEPPECEERRKKSLNMPVVEL